jgi:hypothetical protein
MRLACIYCIRPMRLDMLNMKTNIQYLEPCPISLFSITRKCHCCFVFVSHSIDNISFNHDTCMNLRGSVSYCCLKELRYE